MLIKKKLETVRKNENCFSTPHKSQASSSLFVEGGGEGVVRSFLGKMHEAHPHRESDRDTARALLLEHVTFLCDESSECRKRKSGLGVGVGGPANSLLPVTKCKLQDSNSTYNELFVSLSDVHMSRCEINA